MKNIAWLLLPFFLLLTESACTEPPEAVNPPGYNLAKPVVFNMPSVLEEISGIAFNNGNTETVYAEQDEEGKLFYFHLGDKEVTHTKFSKRGDYEDVAICNGWVIMLRSDGVFFTFPLKEIANKDAGNVQEQDGLLPAGEYESLYADEANQQLYLLCKNCSADKSSGSVSGHIFALSADGKLSKKSQFSVDEKAIAQLAGKDNIKLKASGMAMNPVTHQWYILSSVNRLLLIADAQWKPVSVHALNPGLFTQPEGIAFDKAGNMYIANEKGNAELGTILLFKYQKK
ncbi:MAG: SdiA-regulated domain-containing protein [Chitinophagaceae bacterium]